MELFLTSQANRVLDDICKRLPKPAHEYDLAFIPTASNVYENPQWVRDDREKLLELGFNIIDIDIDAKTTEELEILLKGVGIIFVAGGNTFYLLEKVQESGFDKLIKDRVNEGIIYIGSSAGSVILAPDIEPSKFFDERKESNLKDTKGIGLIDFYPLPHQGNEKYKELIEKAIVDYKDWKYRIVPLTDMQYMHVTDTTYQLIDVE